MLEMRHITKRFGGVKALTDMNLLVKKGEVHALIGENAWKIYAYEDFIRCLSDG